MILADWQIREAIRLNKLIVEPDPPDGAYQPASLEVHLGEDIELFPDDFELSHTLESVWILPWLAAQLTGKSSLARLGLLVHTTAGWIDPGFRGQITLELKNLSRKPIALMRGSPIGQLVFHKMSAEPQRSYGHQELGSHYQDQRGTTKSYLDVD